MTRTQRIIVSLGVVSVAATTFILPYRDPGHDEFAWLTTEPDDGFETTLVPFWSSARRSLQFDLERLRTWWTDIVAVSVLTALIAAPRREARIA